MPVRLPALTLPVLLIAAIAGSRAWLPGERTHPADAAATPRTATAAASHTDVDTTAPLAPARLEAQIAMLDARFAAEPVNADWAAQEEGALRGFLAPDAPRDDGVQAPQALLAVCHSATCRISARYADPLSAEVASQQLALRLADALPYGAVLPHALGDGSIQVDAWYSSRQLRL